MNKESNEKIGTPKNHLLDIKNIPKDVILGVPIVVLTGNIELNIENFRSLLEYTKEIIRVKEKNGEIKITGKNLKIEFLKKTEIKIIGTINKIEFIES